MRPVRPNAEKPKAQYDEHVQIHLLVATDPLPAKDTGWSCQLYRYCTVLQRFAIGLSSDGGRPVGKNLPRGDLGGIDAVEPQAAEEGCLD